MKVLYRGRRGAPKGTPKGWRHHCPKGEGRHSRRVSLLVRGDWHRLVTVPPEVGVVIDSRAKVRVGTV